MTLQNPNLEFFYIDQTRNYLLGPLLGSPNKVKFMVFCPNSQRGTR